MNRRSAARILLCILALTIALPTALAQPPDAPAAKRKKRSRENRQQREKSLRSIAEHLGVGPGSVIADIGAGNGPDTWVFADIVGPDGKVFAEEIDKGKIKGITAAAEKRGLSQVEPVLGTTDDPALPANAADMAFMHFVYHHMTQPREMLDAIWKSLKPGGYLVVVDQRLGTLQDWVPREARGKKHYWIAETTVVREAREQGYRFVECADALWHEKKSFALVFQRPRDMAEPGSDPDPMPPIAVSALPELLPSAIADNHKIAFIALGEGRKLIAPILRSASCAAVDIVLEEWATRKDERPELPDGVSLPAVLTEQGDPKLGPEPLAAVYFLDTYHLLFHGPKMLAELSERLAPSGHVYILDREAPKVMPHRQASHRRMIAVQTVKKEMADAGFRVHSEGTPVGRQRFLLIFEKADTAASEVSGSPR
jgi:predicted methyltransferase